MREPVDAARVRRVIDALGRAAERDVRVYLVGGTSAVLDGWRPSTVDVDLALRPDGPAMLARGLVDPARARALFAAIEPELYRFPAVDPPSFRRAVDLAFPER